MTLIQSTSNLQNSISSILNNSLTSRKSFFTIVKPFYSLHNSPDMNDEQQRHSFEVIELDARIAKDDDISSRLNMLSIHLEKTKKSRCRRAKKLMNALIRENEYLRQKIIYYKESRNAMLKFHSKMMTAFQILREATKMLFERMTFFEGKLLRYWGIDINNEDDENLTVL